jgi:hypothetical protein
VAHFSTGQSRAFYALTGQRDLFPCLFGLSDIAALSSQKLNFISTYYILRTPTLRSSILPYSPARGILQRPCFAGVPRSSARQAPNSRTRQPRFPIFDPLTGGLRSKERLNFDLRAEFSENPFLPTRTTPLPLSNNTSIEHSTYLSAFLFLFFHNTTS